LAQRADGGISAHGELLLSEVANTSSSSGRGSHPAISALSTRYRPRQRAPPRSGYRGSDLVPCPKADPRVPFGTFASGWGNRVIADFVRSGEVNPRKRALTA